MKQIILLLVLLSLTFVSNTMASDHVISSSWTWTNGMHCTVEIDTSSANARLFIDDNGNKNYWYKAKYECSTMGDNHYYIYSIRLLDANGFSIGYTTFSDGYGEVRMTNDSTRILRTRKITVSRWKRH